MSENSIPTVRLNIERRSNHPWIFQKMVEKPKQRIAPGSIVEVVDRTGQWVGQGFYNGHSRIALRLLSSKKDEPVDEKFFDRRLGNILKQKPPSPSPCGSSPPIRKRGCLLAPFI